MPPLQSTQPFLTVGSYNSVARLFPWARLLWWQLLILSESGAATPFGELGGLDRARLPPYLHSLQPDPFIQVL